MYIIVLDLVESTCFLESDCEGNANPIDNATESDKPKIVPKVFSLF